MHIACDIDGGDNAPSMGIDGVRKAASTWPEVMFTMIGVERNIDYLPSNVRHHIVTEVISPDDDPLKSVRNKVDSSLVVGCRSLKEGLYDAFISAGNTGALMVSGLLHTGRIAGVERPALAPFFPTVSEKYMLVLDAGANPEAKAKHLHQYALLGNLYAKYMLHLERPRVGLINIGTEEHKGTALIRETFSLLAKEPAINFIGNIEARELLSAACDVLICDGFNGNLLLKAAEGISSTVFRMIKNELSASIFSKCAAFLLRPAFRRLKKKMDYRQYGGVPFLGLAGPVFKAHGSSDAKAFFHAIKQAKLFLEADLLPRMKKEMQQFV